MDFEVRLMKNQRNKSPLIFVLMALVPYSRQNLMLSFKPNQFFNELEKASGYKRAALERAYSRGQQRGMISIRSPRATSKGLREVKPFTATKLHSGKLMVIFDIPEDRASTRQNFRRLLRSWDFKQVQKSVWMTDKDYAQDLIDIIAELKLGQYVQIYESAKVFP